jgi:hypothetical protein
MMQEIAKAANAARSGTEKNLRTRVPADAEN